MELESNSWHLTPTLDVQLDHFLHHTHKLGIPVEIVKISFETFVETDFLLCTKFPLILTDKFYSLDVKESELGVEILETRSRKFWKGQLGISPPTTQPCHDFFKLCLTLKIRTQLKNYWKFQVYLGESISSKTKGSVSIVLVTVCWLKDVTHKKSAIPTKKMFSSADWKTGWSVWALEKLSSTIGGRAMALVRQPKTAGFRPKSRGNIFVDRLSKC